MSLVGYARVSSRGQSLEIQLEKLAHCDRIFQEHISGFSSQQPRLKACLEYVREGDQLIVGVNVPKLQPSATLLTKC